MDKKLRLWFSFLIVLSFLSFENVYAQKITIGSRDKWLSTAKEWTDIMVGDGNWVYKNTNNKTYWEDAQNASERTTNCALMVVHALQRFGVFDRNNKIWANDEHNLVYVGENTEGRLKAVANIYTYNGKSENDIDLEAGDILYYNGHMNIYIGKNSNGNREYLDAGRGTNVNHSVGGKWESFKKVTNNLGMKIYGIIRLKYGETVEVDDKFLTDNDSEDGLTYDIYENGFVSMPDRDDNFTCQTIFVKENGEPTEFKKILDGVFKFMQFLAPVIAIFMTIIDYMKSLSNGDTKKANIRTIKRIVIAVLVVFLPLILDLLFHVFGLYDISTCEIGR